jgi:hypothetical protein
LRVTRAIGRFSTTRRAIWPASASKLVELEAVSPPQELRIANGPRPPQQAGPLATTTAAAGGIDRACCVIRALTARSFGAIAFVVVVSAYDAEYTPAKGEIDA